MAVIRLVREASFIEEHMKLSRVWIRIDAAFGTVN
jgi:hypothetical protein